MKAASFIICYTLCFLPTSFAQTKAVVTNDAQNIFYLGVDNPVTIAAFDISANSLVVTTDNGAISGKAGSYVYVPKQAGIAHISVFKRENNKLKLLTVSAFRVKFIPPPVFKIASGRDTILKAEFASQEYVRAEVEGGWDITYGIKDFTVCIIEKDSCSQISYPNSGNRLSEQIRSKFQNLKPGDIVIFKNIIGTGPSGDRNIEPRFFTIK